MFEKMFATILSRSFIMRKLRFILPTIALLIGVSIASSLILVTLDVEDRIARELRAFGPNLIVVPRTDEIELTVGGIHLGSITQRSYIPEQDAALIRELPLSVFGDEVKGVLGKNAYLYSIVRVDNSSEILLAGTWFDELQSVNLWWEISGEYPSDNDSVILGVTAARKLGKIIGDEIELGYSEYVYKEGVRQEFSMVRMFKITGIVSTGGEDDSRIFADLDVVQNLTNKEDMVNIMHISALCNLCPLEEIAEIIEEHIPGIEVKTVKQVAEAEMDTLHIVTNLTGIVTIVAILASIMALTTTFSLSVVERRREIGMMKAVGARNIDVVLLFLSEGLIIALVSGIIGFLIGAIISRLIGEFVFGVPIMIRLSIIFLSLMLSIGIVVLSMIIPLRMAMKVDPAVVLRGD